MTTENPQLVKTEDIKPPRKTLAVTEGEMYDIAIMDRTVTLENTEANAFSSNGHLPENPSKQPTLDISLSKEEDILSDWKKTESDQFSLPTLNELGEESKSLASFATKQNSKVEIAGGSYYANCFAFIYRQLNPQFRREKAATIDEAAETYGRYINLEVHRKTTGSLLALQTDIQLPNFNSIMEKIAKSLENNNKKESFKKAVADVQTIMLLKRIGRERFNALEMEEFKSLLIEDNDYNSYLKPGEKIIFHENRLPGEIPNLSETRMEKLLGENAYKNLLPDIYRLIGYLKDGNPTEDPYFNEPRPHIEDMNRREALRKKYGEIVDKFLNSNQLRRNQVIGILSIFELLYVYAVSHGGNMENTNRLGKINEEAHHKYHGSEGSHYERTNNKERLDFVENYLKGAALEVLGMVAILPEPTTTIAPPKIEK